MAAAGEPSGHLMASAVPPGHGADGPLDTPIIRRVRQLVGRTGWLEAGDCQRAALPTRAELAAHGDSSVLPWPLTGEPAAPCGRWVDAMVDGMPATTRLWEGERLLGAGDEGARPLSAPVAGQPGHWTERVQVVRALEVARRQQATLEKHLVAAAAELRALTPAPGRGPRQIRAEAAWHAAIASVLARHEVAGRRTVTWARHATIVPRYVGRGRGGPDRPTGTEVQVRDVITGVPRNARVRAARQPRLGWRVQVRNAPAAQLSLTAAVVHDRGGWSLERDFHLVKDLPLGLSPLFVWKADQIKGMTRLLTLARRLWTLLETQVRRGQEQSQEPLAGLYEGQPPRITDHPTGKRLLHAFARAQITLTPGQVEAVTFWHLTPLAPLHAHLVRLLQLPVSLDTTLAHNSSSVV